MRVQGRRAGGPGGHMGAFSERQERTTDTEVGALEASFLLRKLLAAPCVQGREDDGERGGWRVGRSCCCRPGVKEAH